MRNALTLGITLAVGLALGAVVGYIYAKLQPTSTLALTERQREFTHRLEEIQSELNCKEMNTVGLSSQRQKDGITYFINVDDRYYHVIGFTVDGLGPIVSWAGAGRTPCQ